MASLGGERMIGDVPSCSREGCSRLGPYYAVVCIPPEGGSRTTPLRMIIDLPICEDHWKDFAIKDFLQPDNRQKLRVALLERGKAMPSFKAAWKERGVIGDAHWQAFLVAQGHN